ncbi:MAG: GNAT family N-acetyltransferase [Armatimonadetes bacterium]|nr:GNAT family N-acetyltransferase [Armatimonadota bacterium]
MLPNLRLERTVPEDPRLRLLIEELDAYLYDLDGDELHAKVQPHNHLEKGARVVLALLEDEPVGCGAFRSRPVGTAEIKRMFVRPGLRGHRVGAAILDELEDWARETGHNEAILETIPVLFSAVALYKSAGYHCIPSYPPYDKIPESVCYGKRL